MTFNYELRIGNYELLSAKTRPICIIAAIFFLSSSVFAQENFTVTNYFTEKYRDFPMMKISIIPPAGFVKDTDEVGFINEKYSSAIRAENIHIGVKAAMDSFFQSFDSVTHQDSLGMKLLESYSFSINKFRAQLASLSGDVEGDNYREWRMFIGDSSDAYIIKGFLPARKKKELDREMRAALLSVFYEPNRRILPPGSDYTTTSSSGCGCHNKKK